MCYGTEAYYVDNRFEKVRSGKHLVIVSRNNSGVEQINDIMTEAHQTGFYYRPRIDRELLLSLNPHDVIVTTACIAGIWDDTELILALSRYFKDSFFLELQNHNIDAQKEVNQKMLTLHQKFGIPIIHANDSHYIYPEDVKYREIFLKGKGFSYNDDYAKENDMILDYPDSGAIFERYKKQGILTPAQVQEALENTWVFDDCERITLINTDIKLPPISEHPTEELKAIINQSWVAERDKIPREKWPEYLAAIREEMDTIIQTHMENYFLIDYKVVKLAQEKYGGKLTNTGRGSAPSFYTTKMLGLTDIDRVSAPITLFPSRFMSVDRIINARSLPDIDLNTADREPFIKATEDLLGKENCAWMLAWKPLQDSSAFRLYCKGIGMHISEYDEIAKKIDEHRNDPKWKKLIEESKRFIGVIESVSESPCSMLIYDKPVRKELGLVRTSKDKLCCLLDGYNCDKYKYLKNDYLTTTVWAIIKDTCDLAGIPIPTISELDSMLDDKTFDIYEKGLTCTINQTDSDFATPLVARYQPKNVSEMSAFVAIIRPGCASLLHDFIDRKSYTTGVSELDNLLVEGNHRMIYQELIMKYLIWLGIPETGSYDIIKKIAKKKFKEQELSELKEKLLSGWMSKVGQEQGFAETWKVVEQAAHYSFNACVSGDTIIQRAGAKGHWEPTVEEMYNIMNSRSYAISTGHYPLHRKFKIFGYGNALSMFDDGKVRTNKIVNIYDSEIAPIYRVTTKNGSYLDCTMNHRFPTPNGKKQLSELSVGDMLYVIEPVSGAQTDLSELPVFDMMYEDEPIVEMQTGLSEIISIDYLRDDHVYDIEMSDPAHTFISASGLVTSNSHSLSYAYDSLYGAYLKSHYPLEYYTTVFNYYKDDTTRTFKLKEEIKHFGIELKSAKFRHSKSEYALSREDSSIYKGVSSIKGLNDECATYLYSLRDKQYKNFTELLYDVIGVPKITKSQLVPLIELDFFEEFGDANLLMAQYELFMKFRKNVQVKKDVLAQFGLSPEVIIPFVGKETAKTYMKVDMKGFITAAADHLEYHKRTLREKIAAQIEHLGYIDITGEEYKGMCVVMDVNTKYSPKLSMYSLRSGNLFTCKIDKRTFGKNKLETGDIVTILKREYKPKMKKDEDGGFSPIPGESELWIRQCKKLTKL